MRVRSPQHSRWLAARYSGTVWFAALLAACRAPQPVPTIVAPPTEPTPIDTVVTARALVASETTLSLDLNIPAYRLDVLVNGKAARSYRIAVGMPGFQTHRGTFAITRIQWNPSWVPPKSEWAKDERVTPPGPANPMGKVKLQFHELLFIHGTPDEASLGKPSSHGCVRLSNADAIELATRIQLFLFEPPLVDSVSAAALSSWRSMDVELPRPIPVALRYDLVEVRGETLWVYPDPYGLGTSPHTDALVALAREGLDSSLVDLVRIRGLRHYPGKVALGLPVMARVR